MDEKLLKKIIVEVFDEKFASFYIVPEKHYQDHLWLSDLIRWSDKTKSSILKTIIGSIVAGIIFLLILGFATFYKGSGGGGV